MGIDLSLQSDNTHQGETWDGDDDGNEVEKRVAQLLNNDEINTEYKEAFRQQTIIGWEYIFMGKFAKGWRNCWTECRQWATKFAILMMTWARACWSYSNRTLFGEKTNSYAIQRKRLMAEAKVSRTEKMMERLVGDAHIRMRKKTLKTAESITIAAWLDELHDLRQKIKRGQKESIIMGYTTPEDLREADAQFKRKINAARGMTLRMDRQGVEEGAVDTSIEEPLG